MSSKMTLPAIAGALASGLVIASPGFAQDTPAANPAPQGQGMMGGTKNMAEMMTMMRQMTQGMKNCNRIMESATQRLPAPEKQPAPQTPPG